MPSLVELRQERGQLVEQMRKLLDTAEKQQRDLTAEEAQQWDRLEAQERQLAERIRREERLAELGREMDRPLPTKAGERAGAGDDAGGDAETSKRAYAEAFRAYLRYGMSELPEDQRQVLRRGWRPLEAAEQRALAAGVGAAGGFTVPEGFMAALERDVKAFGGMREAARVIPTTTGNDLPWPTVSDVNNTGELVGENVAATEQDTTFGQIVFKAYKYSSKIVRVSLELLQDSAFDIEGLLASLFAERIARITNLHFTTGDNVDKPQGVVTAATLGKQGAGGQVTSIVYEDLVDMEHAIDPAIRVRPGVRWMMHDDMLKTIKKLKDDQGRPLWMPGLTTGAPDTILGYPYTVNQDMAAPAASARSLLFGDFSRYVIRDVREMAVLRLVERYAEFGQVGFLAFTRHDGRLLDAGTKPIKYYQHAAS